MKRTKYTSEFKEEAVKQVVDKGHAVPDVAQRLGVAEGVLYTWVKKFKKADEPVVSGDLKAMQAEMPKKYWKNLPEASLITELIAESGGRVDKMLTTELRPAKPAPKNAYLDSLRKMNAIDSPSLPPTLEP